MGSVSNLESFDKSETVACIVVNIIAIPGIKRDGDHIIHKSGDSLPIMSAACSNKVAKTMPVTSGKVGDRTVSVLRDSRCSGVVINPFDPTGNLRSLS